MPSPPRSSPHRTASPLPSSPPGGAAYEAAYGSPLAAEPESLAQLLGDCAHMAPHWTGAGSAAAAPAPAVRTSAAPPPEALTGVRVPARSARLLDGMSEYGD